MEEKILKFKNHVRKVSANPEFIHYQWFVQWHLELVERIAFELLENYPNANRDMVETMVWLHDYGKILNFDDQYNTTIVEGTKKLTELGFDKDFVATVVNNIELLDRKMEVDLRKAAIEVQIVSSADGCSHMVGPFLNLWWYENSNKIFQELMTDNQFKVNKDWQRKITLPEAQKAFKHRYKHALETAGKLPTKFLGD